MSLVAATMERPNQLGDALRTVRKSRGETIPELAARFEVSSNTLGAYERGEILPDVDFLAIFSALTGESFGRLLLLRMQDAQLMGRIDPVGEPIQKFLRHSGVRLDSGGDTPAGFTLVPRMALRAGAGGGQLVENPDVAYWLAFRSDWIKNRLRVDPKHLVLVEAVGESMAPTIHDGDLLLLNTAVTRIAADAVYCIAIEGELLVKRVQRQGDGVLLSSDNPAYKPETLDRERAGQLKIVGRVVWHGGVL